MRENRMYEKKMRSRINRRGRETMRERRGK